MPFMALSFLFFICFSVLQIPLFSTATLHKTYHISKNDSPTTIFEVTNPIKVPKTKPCSYLVLKHDIAHGYGKPPILTNYTPPSNCPSKKFSKIVLEWKATCKGRQFDRIFGVWLSGVEIFRSCTAEPKYGSSANSVHNLQKAQGNMHVKDLLVVSGLGSTQQTYRYDDDSGCYLRNISSSNDTLIYDKVSNSSSKLRT
ncbi:hypothetical protein P3L10_021830 [Capsicum annuum]